MMGSVSHGAIGHEASIERPGYRDLADSMGPVPNQPKTPHMSFRIDPDLKRDMLHLTAANGEKVSDVVRRAFETYRDEHRHLLP